MAALVISTYFTATEAIRFLFITVVITTSTGMPFPTNGYESVAPVLSDSQVLELEIFPLSQVFNGLALVKTVALLLEGHRPPSPEVYIRNLINRVLSG